MANLIVTLQKRKIAAVQQSFKGITNEYLAWLSKDVWNIKYKVQRKNSFALQERGGYC